MIFASTVPTVCVKNNKQAGRPHSAIIRFCVRLLTRLNVTPDFRLSSLRNMTRPTNSPTLLGVKKPVEIPANTALMEVRSESDCTLAVSRCHLTASSNQLTGKSATIPTSHQSRDNVTFLHCSTRSGYWLKVRSL